MEDLVILCITSGRETPVDDGLSTQTEDESYFSTTLIWGYITASRILPPAFVRPLIPSSNAFTIVRMFLFAFE